MVYVPDCDAVFARAVENGATVLEPLENKFYGDRSGMVRDPFGQQWSIATHIEDISPEELEQRAKESGSELELSRGSAHRCLARQ